VNHKFLSKYYQDLLIKEISQVLKEQFVIYNQPSLTNPEFHSKTDNNHYMCFRFFENYFLCLLHNNEDDEYIPEQKFNYYLLIKDSFYKEFKKMKFNVSCNYICYNHKWHYDQIYTLFPDVTKFIKGSYSKKRMNYNGTNYISLKLRAFTNTFIPELCLVYPFAVYKNFIKPYVDYTSLQIMAKPVKKKYSKVIVLEDYPGEHKYNEEIKLNDKLALKYNDSYQRISQERIEHILEQNSDKDYCESDTDDDDFNAYVYNENNNYEFEVSFIEYFKYKN